MFIFSTYLYILFGVNLILHCFIIKFVVWLLHTYFPYSLLFSLFLYFLFYFCLGKLLFLFSSKFKDTIQNNARRNRKMKQIFKKNCINT